MQGEGSGVPWLGAELFSQVLRKLVVGGLVVTDGSNSAEGGPPHLNDFYPDSDLGQSASSLAIPFTYDDRNFTCVGYAGRRYGPTLVWLVT